MQDTPNLGFLTVLAEQQGFLGGFLVTNSWGRPLEFRLTTAVRPNRVQEILYGAKLKPYVYADLIGKTLVEKAGVPIQLLVTDCEPLLDLRLRTETPVAYLARSDGHSEAPEWVNPEGIQPTAAGKLVCHPRFPQDSPAIRRVLDQIDGAADLCEPFSRIREALQEARKLGATSRGT